MRNLHLFRGQRLAANVLKPPRRFSLHLIVSRLRRYASVHVTADSFSPLRTNRIASCLNSSVYLARLRSFISGSPSVFDPVSQGRCQSGARSMGINLVLFSLLVLKQKFFFVMEAMGSSVEYLAVAGCPVEQHLGDLGAAKNLNPLTSIFLNFRLRHGEPGHHRGRKSHE
jgi:hypothetical protein